jgi:hypothetical protein
MARRSSSTDTKAGDRFEQRIANLYMLLGFQVEHNVNLSSSQTDLICTKDISGAPPSRLYVECKYRSGTTLSKPEFATFVATYDQLRSYHRLTAAVYVVNSGVTAEAKEFASLRPDIRICTEAELSDELLNVGLQLRRYATSYEQQEIFRLYLPLRTETGADLAARCNDWLNKESTRLHIVLGDFGAGKTTFMRHLKYLLAKDYVESKLARVPLFLPLRDFTRYPDLQSFVEVHLMKEFDTSDFGVLKELIHSGRMLLLLDGFDEMGAQVDSQKRREFFSALTPLFPYASKAIITCRPAYFITDDEMKGIFGYMNDYVGTQVSLLSEPQTHEVAARRTTLTGFSTAAAMWSPQPADVHPIAGYDLTYTSIAALTDSDIAAYLNNCASTIKRSGKTPEWVIDKIKATYDLADLAKRPILLSLIVATLPSIPEDVEPSPSVIYEQYTNAWLSVEYSKGQVRWLIKKSQKLFFMTRLAYAMYERGRLEMHYSELPQAIRDYFKVWVESDLRFFTTDIQACSFLRRDRGGNFEFIHKSFAEFFTAVYIKDQFKKGTLECLTNVRLSPEVLFFLGDLAHVESGLKNRLQKLARTLRDVPDAGLLAANVLGALGYSRTSITGGKWLELDIERLNFTACQLGDVEIGTRGTKEVAIDRCNCSEVRLSTAGRLRIVDSNCREMSATTSVSSREGPSIIISGSKLTRCQMSTTGSVRLENNFLLLATTLSGAKKLASKDQLGAIEINGGLLEDTIISGFRLGSCSEVEARNCWFWGLMIPENAPRATFILEDNSVVFTSIEELRKAEVWASTFVAALESEAGTPSSDVRARIGALRADQRLALLYFTGPPPSFFPAQSAEVADEILRRLAARMSHKSRRPGRRSP